MKMKPAPLAVALALTLTTLAWGLAASGGGDVVAEAPGLPPQETPAPVSERPPGRLVADAEGRSAPAAEADPDGVGACPKRHSPVVRKGLDSSGQPTWWHADGSMTVRVKQGYTSPDGQRQTIARVVVVTPARAYPDPDK